MTSSNPIEEDIFDEEETPLEVSFRKASKHFASLVSGLSTDHALCFYARYKQATEGDCSGGRPSMFNTTARRKFDSWRKLTGVTKLQAMQDYIDALKEIDPSWKEETSGNSSWARVSRMPAPNDDSIINTGGPDQRDATVGEYFLDAVRNGWSDKLQAMPELSRLVTEHFDGLTGLHWAADRGQCAVATLLLDKGAALEARDDAGQTALHYAASCGYPHLVELLLLRDADCGATDEDGLTPKQVADEDVQHLL